MRRKNRQGSLDHLDRTCPLVEEWDERVIQVSMPITYAPSVLDDLSASFQAWSRT